MKSVVAYQNGTVDRDALVKEVAYTTTADDNTANQAAVSVSDIGTIKEVTKALIRSATNVIRVPQGAVTFSGSTVTVVDSGLATGETIFLTVVGYNT
jgi:predicted phosphoribosyltransferase